MSTFIQILRKNVHFFPSGLVNIGKKPIEIAILCNIHFKNFNMTAKILKNSCWKNTFKSRILMVVVVVMGVGVRVVVVLVGRYVKELKL